MMKILVVFIVLVVIVVSRHPHDKQNIKHSSKQSKSKKVEVKNVKYRLKKKHRKIDNSKYQPTDPESSITIQVQMDDSNTAYLLKQFNEGKYEPCKYKEGVLGYVNKSDCKNIWIKPSYIVVTPEEMKVCSETSTRKCFVTFQLCDIKTIQIPNKWLSTPCGQILDSNQNVLLEMCASDQAAFSRWKQEILELARCNKQKKQK